MKSEKDYSNDKGERSDKKVADKVADKANKNAVKKADQAANKKADKAAEGQGLDNRSKALRLMVTRQKLYKNGSVSLARITLGEVVRLMREGKHQAQVEMLRKELRAVRGLGTDITWKMTVERIMPAVLVQKRRGVWLLRHYSGIVMLSVENVFNEEAAAAVKRAAATLPMTLMAFRGSSGMSVKILVWVQTPEGVTLGTEPEEVLAFHRAAYTQMATLYDAILPQPVWRRRDIELTNHFMLSLDDDLLLCPQASPATVDASLVLPKPKSKEEQDTYVQELLQQVPPDRNFRDYYDWRWQMAVDAVYAEADKAGRDLMQEGRESLLQLLTAKCFELHIPLPEARARMLVKVWDVKNAEVARYVNNYYERQSPAADLDPKVARGMGGLERWLVKNYDFYQNIITGGVFFRPRNTFADWQLVGKREIATMTVEAQRLGLNVNVGHIKNYVYSSFIPQRDPVAELLKRVGRMTWDGKDRIEALARLVPTDLKEWPRWFHVWFCAMVNQWSGGDGLHGNACAPLLVGAQAAGKSRFCRALLPPELRWGWIEKVDFSNEVKVMRAMSQFLLMNIDEFNQTGSNVQRGTLKNLMQLPDIRVPKPYAGVFETLPRRASFIGTCNPTEVLADESGNRRFICVQVLPGARIELPVQIQYNQLYAQAVQELRQRREHPERFADDDPRGRTFFTRDEEQAILRHNRRFEQSSLAVELFDSLFEPISTPKPKRVDDGTLELTRAEILERVEKASHKHFSEDDRRRLYAHLRQLTDEGRIYSHDLSKGKGFHVRERRGE